MGSNGVTSSQLSYSGFLHEYLEERRSRERAAKQRHPGIQGDEEGMLEECSGKWRVVLHEDVVEFFERRKLLGEIVEWARRLEESLNRDPDTIMRLLREPVLYSAGGLKRRRYRLYLRGKPYRLLYVVNTRNCLVVFLLAAKRDEETYRRLKRRRH